MLLVVVAHAATAYLQVWPPQLLWANHDPSRSPAFDALFWASVSVAMPAFFVMSGVFAVTLYESRGPAGFARNRGRRIVGPFLVGGATVLPLTLVAWALGWLANGRCTPRQLSRMMFLDEIIYRNLVGPAHLWFLEYLILMLAAFWIVQGVRREFPILRESGRDGLIGKVLGSPLAPVLLAIPTALILWSGHGRFGLDAVTDLRNSFLPDPFRWAHHAWFFVVGAALSRIRHDLDTLIRRSGWWLGLSVPAFLVRISLLMQNLEVPLHGFPRVALAVSGALFGWLALFGVMGQFLRWFRNPRPWVRSLSDSSYGIYLIHFPIVGLAQVALARAPIGCGLKFVVVLAATLFVGLTSDRILIRGSRLGRWLHAPDARGGPAIEASAPGAIPCPSRRFGLG